MDNEVLPGHFLLHRAAITIPRLEFLACLIAARLAENVKKDIKESDIETYYWTDSTNALGWVKREDYWATFVTNRVKEIRTISHPNDWHYIPEKYNPADIPSLGCTIKHLIESRWLQGPEWLKYPKERWPKSVQIEMDEEILSQEKKKTAIVNTEKIWYQNKFSSFPKFLRTIFWVMRFPSNVRKPRLQRYSLTLTVEEIEQAEVILLKAIQLEAFGTVSNPILKSLQSQLDESGVLRETTRLIQQEDTDDFKRPIVLPSKHPVVDLQILEHHRKLSHAGVQTLMTLLREKFWVIKFRGTIRRVIRGCINCQPFKVQNAEVLPAPLPEKRVKNAAAFEITGIDLGGPLYLSNGEKTWFVLLTCAIIRAVHIELVPSLITETLLLAFRRFVSRRGRPSHVYSNNSKNFIGANNIFQSINWQKIEEIASIQRIKWTFIPPTTPWWGEWWERLIRMTKGILRRVLG
nr:uncharacterized protein LOC107439688 [Parasteatoda tepidariorum]